MRYSRLKRSRSRRRYIFMLIIGLLLFGAIYFLSAGAVGRYISEIVAPILDGKENLNENVKNGSNSEMGDNNKGDVELTLPKAEGEGDHESSDGRITESIKIEPLNYFLIQVGAFNGMDNAKLLARDIQEKGGAGYIIEDEYFRVMAMAFATENDAVVVKSQLKEQGVESQVYKLTCSGVNMEVTAVKEKIEGIKSSFSIWREKASSLENIIRELDTDKITTEISINRLREIREELVSQHGKINEYIEANEGNKILEGLQALFGSQIKNLDEILQGNMVDKVAISSKMKYNYIDMIYQFKKYIEDITKG